VIPVIIGSPDAWQHDLFAKARSFDFASRYLQPEIEGEQLNTVREAQFALLPTA
jgi:hypothetical protein